MDSRLDAIFRTGFRPAEKTDTWQGIRREDPADAEQRKDRERKEKPEEKTEDAPVLSLPGLHHFLTMLLQQAGDATAAAPGAPPPSASPPETTRAGYAASAYQTTARSANPAVSLSAPPPQEPVGPSIALSADELRRIHALLADVETLAARGIATITLRPAADFLQSLSNAVKDAL